MCGRFSLAVPIQSIAELFQTLNTVQMEPRYNIAPTQAVITVRADEQVPGRHMVPMKWGLIPQWAKDMRNGSKLSNARSETLHEKPSFRGAFKYRRCIVPADGFYEWKKTDRGKQPYRIQAKDERPLAIAGLWEHWSGPMGEEIQSCTLITTEANADMAPLHHRMPVFLEPEHYDQWLDPKAHDTKHLRPLLRPQPDGLLKTTPVSAYVNKAGNEGPRCITPAPPPKPEPEPPLDQPSLF